MVRSEKEEMKEREIDKELTEPRIYSNIIRFYIYVCIHLWVSRSSSNDKICLKFGTKAFQTFRCYTGYLIRLEKCKSERNGVIAMIKTLRYWGCHIVLKILVYAV